MPSLVTLITTKRPDGGFNVMTASWIAPLSRNPPLIMVAIAPTRFTYECLKHHDEFTVSVVHPDMRDLAWYCGTTTGRKVDKVRERQIELHPLSKVAVPGVKNALAIIGCKLWRDYEGGDHRIIVGEVIEALVRENAFDRTWRGVDMLMYYGDGKFVTLRIP